jgi:diacylglycerol kinase
MSEESRTCAEKMDAEQKCRTGAHAETASSSSAVESTLTGQDMKRNNALVKSFGYAAQGVASAAGERNFKVDCIAAVLAFALCAVLQVPLWGWAAVAICVGVQLAMETVNTAVEAVVDLASPGLHPLAKRAKDCAAGAALITACASVVVACIVYVPALLNLLGVL